MSPFRPGECARTRRGCCQTERPRDGWNRIKRGGRMMGANDSTDHSKLGFEQGLAGAHSHAPKTRILILGGGFGGVYTARHLERLCKRRADVEIVLVSRDNFLVMTPLLFEVCSGVLDARHCCFPVR